MVAEAAMSVHSKKVRSKKVKVAVEPFYNRRSTVHTVNAAGGGGGDSSNIARAPD